MAKAKPIFIPGTNQVFPSANAAAKALGIDAGNIYKVLAGKRQSAGGYQFAYESNRVIHVPQTGQVFSSAKSAAKSLGVRKKLVNDVLSGRRQTVGGYEFTYADKSKITAVATSSSATAKPNKKHNKQQRIRAKRAKKQQRNQAAQARQQNRITERRASAQRQQAAQATRLEKTRKRYEQKKLLDVLVRTQSIRELMERVNSQLIEYDAENLLGYSRVAQNVEAFQDYLGNDDGWLFDTSIDNMKVLAEMSDEELAQWEKQLTDATNAQNGLFWNIKKQKEERDTYAVEFGVSSAEMDAYVDIIPDLWRVFKTARYDDMYETVGQTMWQEIKWAVQSNISPVVLKDIIDKLESYWNGKSAQHLQDILDELAYYQNNNSIFDDDNLPF